MEKQELYKHIIKAAVYYIDDVGQCSVETVKTFLSAESPYDIFAAQANLRDASCRSKNEGLFLQELYKAEQIKIFDRADVLNAAEFVTEKLLTEVLKDDI